MLKVGFVVSSVTRSEYVFIAQRVKFANRQDPYIEKNLTYHQAYGGGSFTVCEGIAATRRTA